MTTLRVLPLLASLLLLSTVPVVTGCFCGGDSYEAYATELDAARFDADVPALIPIHLSVPRLEEDSPWDRDPVVVMVSLTDCAAGTLEVSGRMLDSEGGLVIGATNLDADGAERGGAATARCPSGEMLGFFVPASSLACGATTCEADLAIELTSSESEGDRQVDLALGNARVGSCGRARSDATLTLR